VTVQSSRQQESHPSDGGVELLPRRCFSPVATSRIPQSLYQERISLGGDLLELGNPCIADLSCAKSSYETGWAIELS
jgi:hypothetical protein